MVRTLEGGECHRKLMDLSSDYLRNQGYKVVFQASINNGRIDVIGIKGEEKVGIECQVRPSWNIMIDKAERYSSGLTRFIVAVPKDVKIAARPEKARALEIMKLDVLKPKPKSRLLVSLPDDVERKFRNRVKEKFGKAGGGALSIAATEAINEWLKREAWKNRAEKGG